MLQNIKVFIMILFFKEFDPTQPPRLNEKVLKDKRRKLRETFDRVMRLYVSYMVQTSLYNQDNDTLIHDSK